jgi:hypothetical protein
MLFTIHEAEGDRDNEHVSNTRAVQGRESNANANSTMTNLEPEMVWANDTVGGYM